MDCSVVDDVWVWAVSDSCNILLFVVLDGSDTDGDVDEVVSIVVLAWVWVEELAVLWDPEPDDEALLFELEGGVLASPFTSEVSNIKINKKEKR